MTRAHQPGAVPIDIPQTVPNPIHQPQPAPAPAPERTPVKVPEKVPDKVTYRPGAIRGFSFARYNGIVARRRNRKGKQDGAKKLCHRR